jgi:GTP-binding protein EngB required for normal cell division
LAAHCRAALPVPEGADTGFVREVLGAVEDLCRRRQITALLDFLEACRAFAAQDTLNVAVLGRFKAGKSSFLNQLLDRPLLPVGVVPVTSVVTEIEWGAEERAEVLFLDGRRQHFPREQIGDFVAEGENPENRKQVARVRVELPSMARYRGIRFIDTPGLESVFEHNTEVSLGWLPNVGLALVAVGVDPPLSRQDVELIRKLRGYTPNISILLTKVDVLDESERSQVRDFIEKQLERCGIEAIPVFPYSIRPGFESLREELDDGLLLRARATNGEQRRAILLHKVDSLLGECAAWLNVALRAAEVADSERADLLLRILGQKETLDDARLALKLIVRHAVANTRSTFESLVRADELPIRRRLQGALKQEFPAWTASLSTAAAQFEDWLRTNLTREMAELSRQHRGGFLEPLPRVNRQLEQSLRDFRNRLSDRMRETLGIPLPTTEVDLRAEEPKSPDVRVGRIFDHSWELLSWLIPMTLVRGLVLKHYREKVDTRVFTNLSRLVSQWEETVNEALFASERESTRRLESLLATIEKLTESNPEQSPQIRADISSVEELRRRLAG